MRAISVCKVEVPEIKDEAGKDRRSLRPTPRYARQTYKTCGEGHQECPDHFGHIDLAKPVFHIGYLGKVKEILKCGRIQPNIRREGLELFTQWKKGQGEDKDGKENATAQAEKRPLPASDAHTNLKKMSSEDIATLGLSEDNARPDWMVLTVLPVPPPPVRPSVQDGGEDDLMYKLADVIRANATLKKMEQEGTRAHILADFDQLLQFHCATFMDNDIAGQPQAMQSSGRPIKSIHVRLKGKESRLGGNMMGKRVNFSARTVITGDPPLELDEVGVPKSIARNLTYPERVTPYNRAWLFVRTSTRPPDPDDRSG